MDEPYCFPVHFLEQCWYGYPPFEVWISESYSYCLCRPTNCNLVARVIVTVTSNVSVDDIGNLPETLQCAPVTIGGETYSVTDAVLSSGGAFTWCFSLGCSLNGSSYCLFHYGALTHVGKVRSVFVGKSERVFLFVCFFPPCAVLFTGWDFSNLAQRHTSIVRSMALVQTHITSNDEH